MASAMALDSQSFFQVNDLVEVMARMWPGINKEGGVAKILAVHYSEGCVDNDRSESLITSLDFFVEEDEYLYDVRYMVSNRREMKLEERYIKLYESESGPRKTQGRCR